MRAFPFRPVGFAPPTLIYELILPLQLRLLGELLLLQQQQLPSFSY